MVLVKNLNSFSSLFLDQTSSKRVVHDVSDRKLAFLGEKNVELKKSMFLLKNLKFFAISGF